MARTIRRENRKFEKKTYVGWNHTKRAHHDLMAALNDPRSNHTYDRARIEGQQRGGW